MNKEEYEKFYNILINSPKTELKSFEKDAKSVLEPREKRVGAKSSESTFAFAARSFSQLSEVKIELFNFSKIAKFCSKL